MKILAVEDDAVARATLRQVVRRLGHEIVAAPDGDTTWAILRPSADVRVVVSDWTMPPGDGLDLCRKNRAQAADTYTYFIPLTGRVAERILGYTTQVRQLEEMLPICSCCEKIRDDKNYWQPIGGYISARTGTDFNPSVCADCYARVPVLELAQPKAAVAKKTPPHGRKH